MSIKSIVTRSAARVVLKTKKNSPHILFAAGIAGTIASNVLACRATLKLRENTEDIKENLLDIKRRSVDIYDEKTNRAELAHTYGQYAGVLVKLYGPSVLVGAASIAALSGSHVQLTRRNAALTAAYTGLHQAYNEYRARVRERVGEDAEREIYFGMKPGEITDKDGKTKKGLVVDPNGMSIYARCFDEGNGNFVKDAEINRLFIQCQQNYLNDRLHAIGHVFLNEVYDALGFERTSAGAVVGWVISKEGDNFIDFGLFDCESARFMNGQERAIWLDFNVDGVIYDKI